MLSLQLLSLCRVPTPTISGTYISGNMVRRTLVLARQQVWFTIWSAHQHLRLYLCPTPTQHLRQRSWVSLLTLLSLSPCTLFSPRHLRRTLMTGDLAPPLQVLRLPVHCLLPDSASGFELPRKKVGLLQKIA